MLVHVLAGESPACGNCPVDAVVISGGREGDRPAGSPEVNVSVGRESPVRSTREASNSTGRSESEPIEPRESHPARSGLRDLGRSRTPRLRVKASVVGEGTGCKQPTSPRGQRRRHVERERERKHGTTPGSPRPAGTAKASGISREAKSRRARKWGGWGRLSVNGPGQYNLDRSEGPWGRAIARMAVFNTSERFPLITGMQSVSQGEHEGRTQTRRCHT
jgi:hypothetical protein